MFKSIELVKELLASAKTKTSLKVFASVMARTFATKRKVAENFKATMRIQFDEHLPQWNYTAVPLARAVP